MNPSLRRKPPARAIGVAKRDSPVVLDQEQRRGRVVGDVLQDVPRLLVREDAHSVGCRFGARLGARGHAFLALDAETDQRADLAAELDRLVLGEVAEVLDLDLSVGVLVDGERVDDAHRVALLQPFELSDDLTVELGVVEAQHDELNGSDRHGRSFRWCQPGWCDVRRPPGSGHRPMGMISSTRTSPLGSVRGALTSAHAAKVAASAVSGALGAALSGPA